MGLGQYCSPKVSNGFKNTSVTTGTWTHTLLIKNQSLNPVLLGARPWHAANVAYKSGQTAFIVCHYVSAQLEVSLGVSKIPVYTMVDCLKKMVVIHGEYHHNFLKNKSKWKNNYSWISKIFQKIIPYRGKEFCWNTKSGSHVKELFEQVLSWYTKYLHSLLMGIKSIKVNLG